MLPKAKAKKEAKDQTHAVSRHVTRPPPSVKGWEAWREIQRQKRLNMEDAMRKMKSEGTEEVANYRDIWDVNDGLLTIVFFSNV